MDGLGHTALVAQLVGTVGRLISKIIDAARTARQNKRECEYLAVLLSIIGDVLPRLPHDADVDRPLRELGKTLGEAHELVLACQNWSTARQLIGARCHADSLKEVSTRIDSYINLLNLVFNTTAGRSPRNHTTTAPSPGSSSRPAGPVRLTWADTAAATNYFADELRRGSSEALYKGRLRDGPEVAVKVLNKNGRHNVEGAFVAERYILSPLRHDHIVRLVGWCSDEEDRMFVYEHEQMSNGTLRDHLMRLRRRARVRARLRGGSSSSSPVRATWKARVEVLVGASQAIEHLHGRAVIHRNVSSFNILLDGSWSPRLSGFGEAILQEATGDQLVAEVVGTPSYLDPEYRRTGRVSPASDVYSFGTVMLEALTGEDPATLQVDSALLAIRNNKLRDVLDRRPATAGQLEALELVARTAECCLYPHGKDRPAISKVVVSLARALLIINFTPSVSK
ncbi:hypothetical protein VPH35_057167 [Triticum aestivum]|uniref:Protein kinase domain-containing protein n=1 Tax=Triticum aestivum TaxID=4565 RepID=A0A3B6GKY8_WHEAT|nr:probable serine/threonine-protein kinase PBL28 [Triticum aestivum]